MKRFLLCALSLVLVLAMLPVSAALASEKQLWEEFGYDSLETLLEEFDITEEEYLEWQQMHDESRLYAEEYEREREERERERKEARLKVFEEMGGTLDIMNVMYNGKFIKFADALPEVTDGIGCVPAIPFFDMIGAAYAYNAESRTIIVEFGDLKARFLIGQDIAYVTQDGDEDEIDIGLAPYIKDGTSYIPVRTVAEALGLVVYWDNEYRTVVILDKKGIIEEINKKFTIINSLLQMPLSIFPEDDGNYLTSMELLVTATVFDSLDGDTTVEFGADITIHSDGQNFSMVFNIDLSELKDLMSALADDMYMDEEDLAFFAALGKIKLEVIFNYDADILYIKISGLSKLVPEIPSNAWFIIDEVSEYYEDMSSVVSIEDILREALFGINMGEYVYSEATWDASYRWSGNQIFLYEKIFNETGYYAALYGDAKIVNKEGNYSLTLTQADFEKAAKEYDQYVSYDKFGAEFSVETIEDEITAINGKLFAREDNWLLATQYAVELAIDSDAISLSFDYHVKNTVAIFVELESTTAASDDPIPKSPPAGDKVLSVGDIFSDGILSSLPSLMQLSVRH